MKELLALVGAGVFTMLADMVNLRKFSFPIAMLGLALSISFSISDWGHGEGLFGMAAMDNFALAFNVVLCSIALLWFVMSEHYFDDTKGSTTDQYALVFFALVGALMMVSFKNMTMLFLGVEILSIPMYILAGSQKRNLESNESSFKYFLMGAFAAGFLLFGIALIYGATGSFDLTTIAAKIAQLHGDLRMMLTLGVLLIVVGLGFKVSAAPFHFWAPDVYQGAPTVITAFMATIVKTAAFAAFFRLFHECFESMIGAWADVISAMIFLTLFIGNIVAVLQTNVKRMLAYSSISHAGYMLIAILTVQNPNSDSSILFYTAVYSIASLVAFGVIYWVAHAKGADNIDAFNGLAKHNPILAIPLTLAMLSMAGIPPLAGFMAKYFIFLEAIDNGYIGLIIFAVTMSLVSLYYYLRVIIAMFAQTDTEGVQIEVPALQKLFILLGCVGLLLFGLLPGLIFNAI